MDPKLKQLNTMEYVEKATMLQEFKHYTSRNLGKHLPILFFSFPLSAPVIQQY